MSSIFVNVPSLFEYHVYFEVVNCSVMLVSVRPSLVIGSSLECFYLLDLSLLRNVLKCQLLWRIFLLFFIFLSIFALYMF